MSEHEFVAEAREHLAAVRDHLLNLEKVSGEGGIERIEQLFREVHSVKGGAGFFGLGNIERIAHAMESVLERVQAEALPHHAETVDVLLAATDRIAALLDDVEHSNEWEVDSVLSRLQSLLEQPDVSPAEVPDGSEICPPGTEHAGDERAGQRIYEDHQTAGVDSAPPREDLEKAVAGAALRRWFAASSLPKAVFTGCDGSGGIAPPSGRSRWRRHDPHPRLAR